MTKTLRAAFADQAIHCDTMGSPFMARLLRLLALNWPEVAPPPFDLSQWGGDIGPSGASIPLRICGGLHALHILGNAPELGAVYPPNVSSDAALWQAIETALLSHDAFWTDWMQRAPQTNEVRRAAVLIAASHMLADRYDLPMRVSELGASGGLNLMFDQFHLDINGMHYGPQSNVTLTPDWSGPLPINCPPNIVERRGVDLNPLNAHSADGRLRLTAYLWADQEDRLTRTKAAIAVQDALVDRGDAIEWLSARMPPVAGQLHLIYHTVAWQYFPPQVQAKGKAMIEDFGASATPDAPLAWLSMEADDKGKGAALSLRLWPGNHHYNLGRVDFHGRWVQWNPKSETITRI
ncbi:DUF2332 domain-containing protein [Cochlodiniinecator piscidefendens]|uniref:DUF2332 domain-containing protein n=1 Tax=Cochlodiniinecator piscidefendens TaxID=2715756 RepID=UPI00140941BC|nr:DUF2332 family protein [Cochlodiniinecator piscidefendens]